MVQDRQKVWTDGMDGRTDDAKTISLRHRRGITSTTPDPGYQMVLFVWCLTVHQPLWVIRV